MKKVTPPRVFFKITADGQPLGSIDIEVIVLDRVFILNKPYNLADIIQYMRLDIV